jgi:glycosyltransferase involved in cell wall biosynthesis
MKDNYKLSVKIIVIITMVKSYRKIGKNRIFPKISVVMPVYNSEVYLEEAIESILNQSFNDFEFIIIDDGSKDDSFRIIQRYKDSRICLFHHKINAGISSCLNLGIKHSHGEFIARMDSDDVCEFNRFEEQLNFMQNHTHISLCGTRTKIMCQNGEIFSIRNSKIGDQEIKIALFLGETSISHPTAMMRRNFLLSNNLYYNPRHLYAEDYDLWCRISVLTKLENINEPLVRYRLHEKSVSNLFEEKQRLSARTVLSIYMHNIGVPYTQEELALHYQFALSMGESRTKKLFDDVLSWKNHLIRMNNKHGWFNREIFPIELEKRYKKFLKYEQESVHEI